MNPIFYVVCVRPWFVLLLLFSMVLSPQISTTYGQTLNKDNEHKMKINMAKEVIKTMVENPDRVVFHDNKTMVFGNTVRITFTVFGDGEDSETHTFHIDLEKYITS